MHLGGAQGTQRGAKSQQINLQIFFRVGIKPWRRRQMHSHSIRASPPAPPAPPARIPPRGVRAAQNPSRQARPATVRDVAGVGSQVRTAHRQRPVPSRP